MFSGSMVAIVTPMTADGGLGLARVGSAAGFSPARGHDGIVVAGTTGESPVLTLDEIEELTRRAVARCRGKIKVIVGAGTHSTADHRGAHPRAVPARRRCGDAGDAVLQQAPQEGFIRHFMAAADASAAPVILYNVPSRTAVDLLAEHRRASGAASAHRGAQGSDGSLSRAREIVSACPPEFTLLSGDDATAIDLMSAGARGVISVTANVAPRRMHEACAKRRLRAIWQGAGDRRELAALHRIVRRSESHTGEVGGGENGPHRERNPLTVGRTVGGAPRDGAARDAGRRSYP
jgi:4-hydroxy-tetrahydrodipicolinate synthase